MEHVDNIIQTLQLQRAKEIPLIKTLSEKTGQKEEFIALALVVLLVLFILFTSVGRALLTSLLFFFYPAYKSFLALSNEEFSQTKRWLTYWVVLGFVYSFSGVIDFVLGWMWGVWLLKFAFLLYVLHPALGGHEVIYTKLIKPYLEVYESSIDAYINKGEKDLRNRLKQAKNYAGEKIAENLLK